MTHTDPRIDVCFQALHDATCTLPIHSDACMVHAPQIRDAIRIMLWRLDAYTEAESR